MHSALDGYNGTILAYGQTGSGKTYTITGGEHYSDRGIIPRVLSTIFEAFEQRVNVRYSCYISYLEIYNENVYDLLDRYVSVNLARPKSRCGDSLCTCAAPTRIGRSKSGRKYCSWTTTKAKCTFATSGALVPILCTVLCLSWMYGWVSVS